MLPVGVILAGGRAQRLHGADKALVALAGMPLLARCIARLAPQCSGLMISANDDHTRYASFDIPVVADDGSTREGPLAGLLAAFDRVALRDSASLVLSTPVDTPLLPPDLVARLDGARRATGAPIAVATSGGRRHHAVALWPVAVRRDMRAAFDAGERSVGRFAARHGVTDVDWAVIPVDPFLNINTPADLMAAEALMARNDESGK